MKLFGLLSMFVLLAFPAASETWECKVQKSKNNDFMPSVVTYTIDPNSSDVSVVDNLTKSWGRSSIEGRMNSNNPKRQSVAWSVEGIPTQFAKKYRNKPFSKISFRLTRFKSGRKMKIISRPDTKHGMEISDESGVGKCALIK
jgi:hypothetical protein